MLKNLNDLEKYKIINKRINEEIREFYLINSAFLIVNSGLLATNFFIKKEIILFYLGLFISFLWLIGLIVGYAYRSQWIEKAKDIEDENGIWRNAPRVFPSLMKLFMLLPIVFWGMWFWLFVSFIC